MNKTLISFFISYYKMNKNQAEKYIMDIKEGY